MKEKVKQEREKESMRGTHAPSLLTHRGLRAPWPRLAIGHWRHASPWVATGYPKEGGGRLEGLCCWVVDDEGGDNDDGGGSCWR